MATVAAIDVGTTKTCALIGESADKGQVRVLGVGVAPSLGLRKGVVVDVKLAAQAIKEAVAEAERSAGFTMGGAYVGIAGGHITSTNSRGVAAIGHHPEGVSQDDIDRAMEAAEAIAVPNNREILHALPRSFTLDGQDGVHDPIGMMGFRLEVEAHIVTGASASIQNLVKAVGEANVQVLSLVLEPLAASEAVLQPAEREMGVALVDIGGGTTDIAIYSEGSVMHTAILPTGGLHVTNDLAVGLRAPFEAAEGIKVKFGHVYPDQARAEEYIDIAAFGEEGRRTVPRREVVEIIRARVEEILDMIGAEIKRSGQEGLLPAGIVLTGGTAQLTGMRMLAREILAAPTRVASPRDLDGLADRVSNPAFATSVGLLRWGLARETDRVTSDDLPRRDSRRNGHNTGGSSRALKVLKDIFKVFIP